MISAPKLAAAHLRIDKAEIELLYLPAYSLGKNPIEKPWAMLKRLFRAAETRTREALQQAIGEAQQRITPEMQRPALGSATRGLLHFPTSPNSRSATPHPVRDYA